jgi:hypothetical protein
MEKTKKIFRFLAFVFFIILASTGIGIGQIFSNSREKYLNAEITIEQVEKKEDDGDMELKDVD